MTVLITAEEARKLVVELRTSDALEDGGFDACELGNKAADMIEALHQQLADAQAAVALVVERAAKELDERGQREQKDFGLDRATQNFYRARDIVRALAPDAGIKALAELRAERDRINQWRETAIVERDTYSEERDDALTRLAAAEAANAALEAQVARLVGARPTLNWCRAEGQTIHEMRVNLQSSPFGQALIDMGDCALVWANEGDLYQFYAALASAQGVKHD